MRFFQHKLVWQLFLLAIGYISTHSSHATADNFKITRNIPTGELILSGPDCKSLKAQASALAQWRRRLNESAQESTLCQCDSIKCYINIETVSPEFVKKFHGVKAGRWGPNCWNATLVANKILPSLRFSPPEEMSFWMNSSLCRMLKENETALPGDIITIRDQDNNEVHGFTYITDDLVFSKNYLTTLAPYELQETQNVFQNFPVPHHCRKKFGDSTAECKIYANYYRCQTMARFTLNIQSLSTKEIAATESKILSAETLLSSILFDWNHNSAARRISPLLLADLQREMRTILRSLEEKSIDPKLSADERFLWRSLVFRAQSIIHSISWI